MKFTFNLTAIILSLYCTFQCNSNLNEINLIKNLEENQSKSEMFMTRNNSSETKYGRIIKNDVKHTEISENGINIYNKENKKIEKKNNRSAVKLNLKQGLTMNQILSVYSLSNVSNQLCKNHSTEFNIGLRAFEPWALQMFDSSSKLQSGILMGNLVEFGAFQQCIEIYKETDYGPIHGKHCSINISPDIELLRKILEFRNISRKDRPNIQQYHIRKLNKKKSRAENIFLISSATSWFFDDIRVSVVKTSSPRFGKVHQFVSKAKFIWAICIPHTCTAIDVLNHFEKIIATFTEGLQLNVSITDDDCMTIFHDKPLNRVEMGIIGIFACYFLILTICTIIDLSSTPTKSSNLIKIFSFYSNSRQILFAKKNTNNSDLDCVHGIRFLSTCYVVIGHRYLMMMFFPLINSLKIMDWVLYYRSTTITGGTLCVDTFFMVSGMLVSIGYFEQMSKSGKMNWIIFYLSRYMRITLPLAIVVLCYSTLIHHLGSGPLWWDMLETIQKPCQEYWWATLLHIQNYVHPYPLCMTQAWYLTCDMQYYVLSPLILLPLWKWPIFGYFNYILIYIISVAINFYLAWINKYEGSVPVTNQLFSTKYFQYHYITPHTRAATYIIGLGLGYSIYKAQGNKMIVTYPVIVFGWLVAIATMLAALVGCHAFHLENHNYNRLEASIYISFARSAWTFGIVWIVWACINGYGGPINSVLSSHIFRILGRISYSIYLLHMLMQYLMSGTSKMPAYFSDFSALYAAFSDLFIMIVIGFVFTVCFESPLVRALALLSKEGNKKKISPTEATK